MTSGAERRTGIILEIGLAIERVGWSEAARRSGVDRTHLHRSFGRNGRLRPSLATLDRILPHLGLQLALERVR